MQKVETQKACQNLIRQIHKLLKRKFEANTCKQTLLTKDNFFVIYEKKKNSIIFIYKNMTKKLFISKYFLIQFLKVQSLKYIQEGYQKMVEQIVNLIPKKQNLKIT